MMLHTSGSIPAMPSEASGKAAGNPSDGHGGGKSAFSFLFGGKKRGGDKKTKGQPQEQHPAQPQPTNDLDSAGAASAAATASAAAAQAGPSGSNGNGAHNSFNASLDENMNIHANGSQIGLNNMNSASGRALNDKNAVNGSANNGVVNSSSSRKKLQSSTLTNVGSGSVKGSAARLKLQAPALNLNLNANMPSAPTFTSGPNADVFALGLQQPQQPQPEPVDRPVIFEHELLCGSASPLDLPTVTHEHLASLSELELESPRLRLPTFIAEAPTLSPALGLGARLDANLDAERESESPPAHEYELGPQPKLALEAAASSARVPQMLVAGAAAGAGAGAGAHVRVGSGGGQGQGDQEVDKEVAEIVAAPSVRPKLRALKPKVEGNASEGSGGTNMEVAVEDPSVANFLPNSIGNGEIKLPSGSLRIATEQPAVQLQVPAAPKSSPPPESARESPRSEVSALNALAAATRSESVGLNASGGSGFDQPDLSLSVSGTATGLAGALGLQRQAQAEASAGLQMELSLPPEQSPPYVNIRGLGAPQVQAQAAGETPSGPYMNMMALNVQPPQPPVPQASVQGGFGIAPVGGSRKGSQASLNLQGPQLQSQVALQAPDPTLDAQVNAPQSQLLNGQLGLQQMAVNGQPQLTAQMNAPQVDAQLSVPQMATQRDARQVTAQMTAPQVQVPVAGKAKEQKKKSKLLGLFSSKPKDKNDKRAHASGGVSTPMIKVGVNGPAVKVGVNKPAIGVGVNGPAVGVGLNGPAVGVGVDGPAIGVGVNGSAVGEQTIAPQPALGLDMSAPTSLVVSAPAQDVGAKIGANGYAAPVFSGSVRGMHTPIPMPALPQVDARAGAGMPRYEADGFVSEAEATAPAPSFPSPTQSPVSRASIEMDPLLLSTNSVSLGPPFSNAATGSPPANLATTLATRADLPDGPPQGAQMSPQLPQMQTQPLLDPNAPIVLSYAGSTHSSVRVVQNERNVSPVALGGHMSTITLTSRPAHQSRSGRSTPRSPTAGGKHSRQGSANLFTATAVPPLADLNGVARLVELSMRPKSPAFDGRRARSRSPGVARSMWTQNMKNLNPTAYVPIEPVRPRSKSPTAPLHFAMRAQSPAATQPGHYVRSNGRARAGSRTPSPTPLRATVFSTQPPGTGVEAESQEVRMLQQRLMQRPYYMLDPALAASYARADFYAPLNYTADPYAPRPEFGVHLTEQQAPPFDPNQPTMVMLEPGASVPASHLHEFLCTWQRAWAGAVPEREHATLCTWIAPEAVAVPPPATPEPEPAAPVPKPRSVSRATAIASEVLVNSEEPPTEEPANEQLATERDDLTSLVREQIREAEVREIQIELQQKQKPTPTPSPAPAPEPIPELAPVTEPAPPHSPPRSHTSSLSSIDETVERRRGQKESAGRARARAEVWKPNVSELGIKDADAWDIAILAQLLETPEVFTEDEQIAVSCAPPSAEIREDPAPVLLVQPTLPLIPTTTSTTTVELVAEPLPEQAVVKAEPIVPSPPTELLVVEPLVTVVTPVPAPSPSPIPPAPPEVPPETIQVVAPELTVQAQAKVEDHPYANLNGFEGLDIEEEFRRASIVLGPDMEDVVGANDLMGHRNAKPERSSRLCQKTNYAEEERTPAPISTSIVNVPEVAPAPVDLDLELAVTAATDKRRPSTGSVGSTGNASNWILNARSPLAIGTRQDSLPYMTAQENAAAEPMHFRRSFVRLGGGKQGKKQSNRRWMRDVAIEATFHQGNEEDEMGDVDHSLLSGRGPCVNDEIDVVDASLIDELLEEDADEYEDVYSIYGVPHPPRDFLNRMDAPRAVKTFGPVGVTASQTPVPPNAPTASGRRSSQPSTPSPTPRTQTPVNASKPNGSTSAILVNMNIPQGTDGNGSGRNTPLGTPSVTTNGYVPSANAGLTNGSMNGMTATGSLRGTGRLGVSPLVAGSAPAGANPQNSVGRSGGLELAAGAGMGDGKGSLRVSSTGGSHGKQFFIPNAGPSTTAAPPVSASANGRATPNKLSSGNEGAGASGRSTPRFQQNIQIQLSK